MMQQTLSTSAHVKPKRVSVATIELDSYQTLGGREQRKHVK